MVNPPLFRLIYSMKAASSFSALQRQRDIYLHGLAGRRPAIPTDLNLLEGAARRRMSRKAFGYIAGGAGVETTIQSNRSGFNRWRIVPRMLKDVSEVDMGVELFGRLLPAPLLLAPIGVLEMVHQKADLAVAEAAGQLKVPYIFSNQASVPMEVCSQHMGNSPRWFQLYWSTSNDLVASLVRRAEACGCEAIVVTLDTTMLGWRLRDLDLASLPFLKGMGIAQYTSDPVFQRITEKPVEEDLTQQPKSRINLNTIRALWQMAGNYPGSRWHNIRSGKALKAVRTFINTYTNPALNWEDLAFLRDHTQLPILLKGILHPQDAQRALDEGMDGIIVSNHGGRQVDGAISTIDALPDIVQVIGGKIPVLMDSGIRSGADMFKAIALGASAVCLGRPYVYGLALQGAGGVEAVIRNLMADFELTMRLSGCKTISDIRASTLQKQST